MIISGIMTKNPLFVHPDMPINDVRAIMVKEKIGQLPVLAREKPWHLPVFGKNKTLVGLITKKDLLRATPSAATSLDMYEISYLLSKLTAKDIMSSSVVAVGENEVIEEAARIMVDKKIGCLPVMRDKLLVGIITDTDIFHFFVDAFGARYPGVRLMCSVLEKPGQIARLTHAIAERGGNLVAFVTSEGEDLSKRRVTLKVTEISREDLEVTVKELGDVELEDIR